METDIKQLLPTVDYQAIIAANAGVNPPSASNPFATIADITGGVPSDTVEQTFIAGESIIAGRVVKLVGGALFHLDPTNAGDYGKSIGVARTSNTIGLPVSVVTNGYINGLTLIPDTLYYVGLLGALVTTPAGIITQQIGVSISATEMIIDIKIPIKTI
jgi:hypothetical protein